MIIDIIVKERQAAYSKYSVKGVIPMEKIAVTFIALLALILSMAGCGGQGSSGSIVPVSTDTIASDTTASPTAVGSVLPDGDDTVESSVAETSSSSSLIRKDTGGSVTVGRLKVTIPPSALSADTTIKAAAVTVTDDGVTESGSQCYQISTDSAEEGAELSLNAAVTITVDQADAASPELEIWDGFEWISGNAAYNSTTRQMTFSLNYIGPDLDQFSYCNSSDLKVKGPVIFEVRSSKSAARSGIEKLQILSGGSHFIILFPSEDFRTFAEYLGRYLEEGYTFYSDQGFSKPISFIDSPKDQPYILVDIFPSDNNTATSYTNGLIRIPTVRIADNEMTNRSLCFHELFHLVTLSYSGALRRWPPNWMDESRTEAIAHYGANYVVNGNKGSYYDVQGSINVPGPRGFNYPLDSNSAPDCYNSFVFWSYIMKKYGGVQKFKEFVSYDRNVKYNLTWLDGMCGSLLKKPLQTVYAEAFEDYYANGSVFNRNNFCNTAFFPSREADMPYPLPIFILWAFSGTSEYNVYSTAQALKVSRCSGSYVIFSNNANSPAETKTGTLCLSVANDYPDDVKIKAYRFLANGGQYTLEGSGEMKTGDSEFASFGTTWNVMYLLIENKSLTSDRTVKLRAYGKEN